MMMMMMMRRALVTVAQSAVVETIPYTRGLGTPTANQHNMFSLGKDSHHFLVLLVPGIRTIVLWILNPMLYQLSHPFTPDDP